MMFGLSLIHICEPRVYASIGFSGCVWPCASTIEAVKKNVYVYYWKGASGYGASGKDKAVGSGDANNYPVKMCIRDRSKRRSWL